MYVSKGPVVGTPLTKLIIQAISILLKARAKVYGVASDMEQQLTNRKFWSIFGVSGDLHNVQCWFPHPTVEERRVYVFADTVHLIKNVWTRLHAKNTLRVYI